MSDIPFDIKHFKEIFMREVQASVVKDLWQLYREFTSGEIIRPTWQRRKGIWEKPKQQKWKDDIESIVKNGSGAIPGMIVTFSLSNDRQKRYLNDGLQRIGTTVDYAKQLLKGKNGIGENELMRMFSKVNITIQHFTYDTMKEAFDDFFKLQLGTPCLSTYCTGQGAIL
jgi:hypothetical protein